MDPTSILDEEELRRIVALLVAPEQRQEVILQRGNIVGAGDCTSRPDFSVLSKFMMKELTSARLSWRQNQEYYSFQCEKANPLLWKTLEIHYGESVDTMPDSSCVFFRIRVASET